MSYYELERILRAFLLAAFSMPVFRMEDAPQAKISKCVPRTHQLLQERHDIVDGC